MPSPVSARMPRQPVRRPIAASTLNAYADEIDRLSRLGVGNGLAYAGVCGTPNLRSSTPAQRVSLFQLAASLAPGTPGSPSSAAAQPQVWDPTLLQWVASNEASVTIYDVGALGGAQASGAIVVGYLNDRDWFTLPVPTAWGKFVVNTGQTLSSGTRLSPTSCTATQWTVAAGPVWSAGSTVVTVYNTWTLCATLTAGSQLDCRQESGYWWLCVPTGNPGGD